MTSVSRVRNVLLVLCLVSTVRAQQAAVVGTTYHRLVNDSASELERVDLGTKKSAKGALKFLKEGDYAKGIVAAQKGLLLLAETGLWRVDPAGPSGELVLAAPEEMLFDTFAHDPASGVTLITATPREDSSLDHEIWVLPSGGKELMPVLVRRLSGVSGLSFMPGNRLVVCARGDLWIGALEPPLEGEEEGVWGLTVERFCPMGDLEAMNGTSSSQGALEAVQVGDKLLVLYSRLGGSGDTTYYTVPLPSAAVESIRDIPTMAKCLSAVKELGTNSMQRELAGDPEGKKAWLWLSRDEEKDTGIHVLEASGKLTSLGVP